MGEPLFSPNQKGIGLPLKSALIIEFVSESYVAELIQHQKVIDYTATYNG